MLKKKAMVIPYIVIDKEPFFLLFKNKKYKTWGFMSGTGELNESYNTTAYRELEEETKRIFSINKTNTHLQTYFFHKSSYFLLPTKYKAFFLKLSGTKTQMNKLVTLFKKTKAMTEYEDENTEIKFVKPNQMFKHNFWDFLRYELMKNKHFNERLIESINNDIALKISSLL